jgi:hypothetical protein
MGFTMAEKKWTLPHLIDIKISGKYNKKGEKMGKQDK